MYDIKRSYTHKKVTSSVKSRISIEKSALDSNKKVD